MRISLRKVHIFVMALSAFLLILSCGIVHAAAQQAHSERELSIDTIQDAKEGKLIRIQYTDIIVHLTDSGWLAKDSVMFFSQRTKVEWASKILLEQIGSEKDSLSHFVDSAGARIERGMLTQKQVDVAVGKMTKDIQKKVTTQEYALKRLDDYRHVLETVKRILKRVNNE